MKLILVHRRAFGRNRFYPVDDFGKKFLTICQSDCNQQLSFTEKQIKILKELGFYIEIKAEYIL